MDQVQRRDIDTALERVSLGIDEENVTVSPYLLNPTVFVGNNWFVDEVGDFVKLGLAEDDSISFPVNAITTLVYKDITGIIVSFDYDVNSKCILRNVGLVCAGQTLYKSVETLLKGQGHIDVDCSLFGFESSIVDTAISEQGFSIGLNFDGVKSNATVILSNVTISLKFQNKLQTEMNAVANRISATFDAYVEEEDLVIEFFGSGGKGGGSSESGGGVDVDTVKYIVNTAINNLSIYANLGLLSNGYVKLDVDLEKGDD